jgi:excinuclease ABC subunit C
MSELDHVRGIGPARRAALLKAFGSVVALSHASPEEISQRAGLSVALAARVAEHLAGLNPEAAEERPADFGTGGCT